MLTSPAGTRPGLGSLLHTSARRWAAHLGNHRYQCGGVDLQFAHHENELEKRCAHGGKVFARFWLHNGMLTGRHQMSSACK